MPIAEGRYTPPPCPACAKDFGRAFTVKAEHFDITVTYRCQTCSHEWTSTRPDPERPAPSAADGKQLAR